MAVVQDKRRNRYTIVEARGHSRASDKGRVLEHLLIAEQALGRPVPLGAEVHHIDGNGKNNAPSNLVICEDQAYHQLLHRRLRALRACGNPDALPCNVCGEYDAPKNLRVFMHRDRARVSPRVRAYHRPCKNRQNAESAALRNQWLSA